jgi:hypothetical protein
MKRGALVAAAEDSSAGARPPPFAAAWICRKKRVKNEKAEGRLPVCHLQIIGRIMLGKNMGCP